jgi:hypothetical protein
MSDLEHVIANAVACTNSLTFASTQYLKALETIREASIKCESDLAQKVNLANETIANLRTEIQHLREDKIKAEREVAMVIAEKEKELRKYNRFIEEGRAKIDKILAA